MEWTAKLKDLVTPSSGSAAASLGKLGGAAAAAGEQISRLASAGAAKLGVLRGAASKLVDEARRVREGVSDKGLAAAAAGAGLLSRAWARLTASKEQLNLDNETKRLGRLRAAFDKLNEGSSVNVGSAQRLLAQIRKSEEQVDAYRGKLIESGVAQKDMGEAAAGGSKALGVLKTGAKEAWELFKVFSKEIVGAARDLIVFGTRAMLGELGMARLRAGSERLRLNLVRLFKGIDASALLRAQERAIAFFSKTEVSGRAVSGIIERAFGSMFSLLDKAAPYVQEFALGVVYGALLIENSWLRIRIALLPVTNEIRKLVGDVDVANFAFYAGATAAFLLAGAVTIVGVSLLFAASPLIIVGTAVGLVVYGVIKLVEWFRELIGATGEVQTATTGLADAVGAVAGKLPNSAKGSDAAGKAIGDGLIEGLRAKLPAVMAAGAELAKAADQGVRSAAEIRSPARRFRVAAVYMGQGVEMGLRDSAAGVQRAAAASLVPELPPVPVGAGGGATAAPGPAAVAAGGGVHLIVSGNTINVRGGAEGGQLDLEAAIEAVLRRAVGEAMIELGLAVPARLGGT